MFNQLEQLGPPKEAYLSIRDWVAASCINKSQIPEFYKEFIFDEIKCHLEPKSVEKTVHWKFRWERERQSPQAYVAVLPGGRVLGSNGAVLTSDNKLLWDVSIEYGKTAKEHSVFWRRRMPPATYTSETTAVLTFTTSGNFYHWMFDVLARLALLGLANIPINRIIINPYPCYPFHYETLKALGIPQEAVLMCHQNLYLQAERLIVPSLVGYNGHMPKWACDFLRKKFLGNSDFTPLSGYERIYLSRENALMRKVLNEADMKDVLAEYGFKSIVLELLSVAERIRIFASAKMIVSPHGAGLTNLLFCNQGTKVVEFFSPNYVNSVYWVLGNHVELDYYYLIGEGPRPDEYVDPHIVGDNIRVNLDVLRNTLKLAGI